MKVMYLYAIYTVHDVLSPPSPVRFFLLSHHIHNTQVSHDLLSKLHQVLNEVILSEKRYKHGPLFSTVSELWVFEM
jgi:hypothetical protein